MKIKINDEITQNISDIELGGGVSLSNLISNILLQAHPVGSYYWSDSPTNPATLFGGTWTQIKDKFVIAVGDNHTVNTSYGSNTKNLAHTHTSAAHTHTTGNHTLTTTEIPSHNHGGRAYFHGYSGFSGGSSGNVYVFNWSSSNCIVNQNSSNTTSLTQLCNQPSTTNTGGSGAHNHGDTGSTTPGATGSSLSSSFDVTPACVAAYCWKRTA